MDDLIREVADKHGVRAELIKRLIDYEWTKVHLQKRRGAKDDLRRLIEEYIEGQRRET